ncbi:MAG: hypothetical protein IIC57_08490 [Proteobacteria bacterium]|nr:hypothetical protein [Pseudomonadota bacterium]
MRTRSRCLAGLMIALSGAAITPATGAEHAGTALDHAFFDANHCLTAIRPSPADSAVEFHWGCAKMKLITISCVFDRTGYLGLGPRFARPGWHCNHPLPVPADETGRRISDVAVGDPGGPAVWAACAVADLGEFDSRPKPYQKTECYRAMIAIGKAVNGTGRHPDAVADEILP